LVALGGALVIVGLAHWIGHDRFPGRINDDEGTYVAQAYAVQALNSLAHYTYWYDHPPLGWITMAGYTWLTDAFERLPTAVSAGREIMVWIKLVSAAMIYLLGRRLGYHRLAAAGAVLIFGLSPLALMYQRMVFLDNLAVMWSICALVLAVSPRKSLAAAAGSAVCFAMAVLTKETALVLFPAVFMLLWRHTPAKTRQYRIPLFLTLLGGLILFYPLYATLKNELFEGPGHVSLLWAIKWQLFGRPGSGSLLNPGSHTSSLVRLWMHQDPWLLGMGVLLTPVGLLVRSTRPVAVALAIQVAMMCRNGYMPQPYVIAMLPFAAMVIAGVTDQLLKNFGGLGHLRHHASPTSFNRRLWIQVARVGQLVAALIICASLVAIAPAWGRGLRQAMTEDHSRPPRQALEYLLANVQPGALLLVDDNIWTDLVRNGFNPNPIWFYKLDLDPAIRGSSKRRWRDIDYVVLGNLPASTLRTLPLVTSAIEHSDLVADFGEGDIEITIRRVNKYAPD
jgi:4-amino-4-deoxy-L-arabinose transferase-like glycosyltransferase